MAKSVIALPKGDEMVRQQDKLSVYNTRAQSNVVRTISGNCGMDAPSGPHVTALPVTHALRLIGSSLAIPTFGYARAPHCR